MQEGLEEPGTVGVRGNLVVDCESKRQSFTACLGGNARLCAGAHGVKEVFELKTKGFAFGDIGLQEGEAGGGMRSAGGQGVAARGQRLHGSGDGCRGGRRACSNRSCDGGGVYADGQEFLAGEVEREILVGLEEAQFADLLGGDAAGSEVGNAAGFECDTYVGDVGFGREYGQSHGPDFSDG